MCTDVYSDSISHLCADGAVHEVDGALQDVPPLRRHQLRQRPRKEARGREPQAPVPAVGQQPQTTLQNVIQQALVRVMAITMGPIKEIVCTLCPYT